MATEIDDVQLLESARQAAGRPKNEARPESLSLPEMLERFVHIAKGPVIVDAMNTYRKLRVGEFTATYAHCKVPVGDKTMPITSLWAQSDQRMTAHCLTFHPGEDQFYIEHGLRHFNIWSPPDWPAADLGLAVTFTQHLAYLIPDTRQREDLLDWLAHAAQRPEIRPHFHFLLVAAQEGTGRSWLADLLVTLWADRHAGSTDLHQLMDDNFNSELSGKILMAVHEVKAPADERYSHRDRLKSLLTDTKIRINEKHEVRWTERFCTRFLMFTNRDDALPLSENDRRVYVITCTDKPRDADYYISLYSRLKDQRFLAAVWHLLRNRNIRTFNPGARAPLNAAKQQMINASRSDEQQDAADFVKEFPFEVVAANDVMDLIAPRREQERDSERTVRTNAVRAVMRELGAQTYSKKVKVNGSSVRVWMLRNPSRWSGSLPGPLGQEAGQAQAYIRASHWDLDAILKRNTE